MARIAPAYTPAEYAREEWSRDRRLGPMAATERVPPRRGRRPGSPDTRAAVLSAARERFAAQGYAGTSVRAVAAAAGVDPALVHHYFGTKDDLFLAALEVKVDPRLAMLPVIEGGVDGAGERLLRVFVRSGTTRRPACRCWA